MTSAMEFYWICTNSTLL